MKKNDNIDEIINAFQHKKSLESPADFTNNAWQRILRKSKSTGFYFPLALKIAASVILLVVNTYTIYYFVSRENRTPAPATPSALVRFYQSADTSADFAYQLIRHK